MQLNTATPPGKNISINKNGTYSGNYHDVDIKKNIVATLTGTIFHNITIEEGANLTFTQPIINVEKFVLQNGKAGSGNRTRLNFAGNTSVRMNNAVQVQDWCLINEGGFNVTFFMEKENFNVDGKGTRIIANVYAPNGDITVNGDDMIKTYMTGRYIAQNVHSGKKNVIWSSYDCDGDEDFNRLPLPITNTIPDMDATDLQVKVFPNPTNSYFNLSAISASKEELHVNMYNVVGLKVQEFKTMPGQMMRLGDHIVSGTYLIEVIQGSERVTLKVLKQ